MINHAPGRKPAPTAIVYCEGEFGELDGKTANGLVRHSERYRIESVIDSTLAGRDAGEVLDGRANGIPIHEDVAHAIEHGAPDVFIYGKAPATGVLSSSERQLILAAIGSGMGVVNGLHEFLNDDPRFASAAKRHGVQIRDVRRPRDKKDLRLFTGGLAELPVLRIAVLGTDCAIGKRTTAAILVQALNARGIKAVLIGTGQTGLIQGARFGLAMDAVPSQFCAGELEATIMEAYHEDRPQVVVIEGQGALSHPAYSTSSFILRGSTPHGVIVQHAPARVDRCDFPGMRMPSVTSEIKLIETFSNTKVIGMALNHENMDDDALEETLHRFEQDLGLPVTDALRRPADELVDMVVSAFPDVEGTAPLAS